MSKKEKIGMFVLRLLLWVPAVLFVLVLGLSLFQLVKVYYVGCHHTPYEWGCWDFEEWHLYGWDAVVMRLEDILSILRYGLPVIVFLLFIQLFAFCGLCGMKETMQQASQEKAKTSDDE